MQQLNYSTLLTLFSLKHASRVTVMGAALILVLAIFTVVASALCEITSSISYLWVTSDSITRLLMLVLAVYIIRKAFPYIVALHARGVL